MKQNNASQTGLIIVIIIVVLIAAYVSSAVLNRTAPVAISPMATTTMPAATSTIGATTTTPVASTTPVATAPTSTGPAMISTTTAGVFYKYPATLSTNYIQTVDWPPIVVATDNQFICTQTGSVAGPNGKTSLVTINTNPYCVTVEGDGAAGSSYYQYTYEFPKSGKTMVLTFTLRYPVCENYNEPKTTECKNEEASFDVNALGAEIAQSVRYNVPFVSSQPAPAPAGVAVNSISPGSGPVGTSITLTGTGFTGSNKVLFDNSVAASNVPLSAASSNGMLGLTFTLPSAMGPDCKANEACPMYELLISPGTYTVTVENSTGTSNAISFVVTR